MDPVRNPMIHTIVTRLMNVETACFLAMLKIFPLFRESLGIAEDFGVTFESPFGFFQRELEHLLDPETLKVDCNKLEERRKYYENLGFAFFNIGGELTRWDQHGKGNEACSLDLAIMESMKNHCWSKGVSNNISARVDFFDQVVGCWRKVSANDLHATRLDSCRFNLKTLLLGLQMYYRAQNGGEDDHQALWRWSSLAFAGVFRKYAWFSRKIAVAPNDHERARLIAERSQYRFFHVKSLKQQVKVVDRAQYAWFKQQTDHAVELLKQEQEVTEHSLSLCSDTSKHIFTPPSPIRHFKSQLRGIVFHSKSFMAGPMARKNGYDVVVIRNPDTNQVQIAGRFLFEPYEQGGKVSESHCKAKWQIKLDAVIAELRFAEAEKRGLRLAQDSLEYRHRRGLILFEDGAVCPWYFPEFETLCLNGSHAAPDTPPTLLTDEEILAIIRKHLPFCGLIFKRSDRTPEEEETNAPLEWEEYPVA